MAPLPELMVKPRPGDMCMMDPDTRLTHHGDIAALVADVTEATADPDEELVLRTDVGFSIAQSSGDLGSDPRYRIDDLTDADLRVANTALMFGLALGMAEVERGWRVGKPIRRHSGSRMRRWREDKRPRNADPRTLEALHDLQQAAFESQGDSDRLALLCRYLVILGYWYSFEDFFS